ncbi:MAG: hypothetical protein RLZZ179_1410 [Verrucomicrobiota bacterium]|jgi:hypothetical protein
MSPFERIAEERIAAALPDWEAEVAHLHGTPLNLDAYFAEPASARAGNQVLRNAGILPPEATLLKEIAWLREQLDRNPGTPQAALQETLRTRETELAMIRERRRGRHDS